MRNEEPDGFGINGVVPGSGICVVAECGEKTGTRRALMCYRHWRAVPRMLKANLDRARADWVNNKTNLGDLREAQWACVDSVTP